MRGFFKKASCPALVVAGAALALGLAVNPAQAAEKPVCDTVEIISHASPGGGTDTTIRMWLLKGRRYLVKGDYADNVIVVYKRGGGARAAHEYFAERPADGCTLMAITQTHMYTLARKSPITIDDMIGVARAMDDPMFMTVRADNEDFKTIDDLVNTGKKRPIAVGGALVGSTCHILIDKFAETAGFKYKYVPFGSAGPMNNALLSGAVEVTSSNVSEGQAFIKEGQFRPIVLFSKKRLKDYPDVPTAIEKGWNVTASTTRGYVVKKGTPEKQIEALEESILKAMKHEMFANYLESSALDPETSPAGVEVWDEQLKEMAVDAQEAIERMGLLKKQAK